MDKSLKSSEFLLDLYIEKEGGKEVRAEPF